MQEVASLAADLRWMAAAADNSNGPYLFQCKYHGDGGC